MGKMKIKSNKNGVVKKAKQNEEFRTIGILFEETDPIYYSGPVMVFVDIGEIMGEYSFRKTRDEVRGVKVHFDDIVEKTIYESAIDAANVIRFKKFMFPPAVPTTMTRASIENSDVFQALQKTVSGINDGTTEWRYPAQMDGLKIKPISVHVLEGKVSWNADVKTPHPLKPIEEPTTNDTEETVENDPPISEVDEVKKAADSNRGVERTVNKISIAKIELNDHFRDLCSHHTQYGSSMILDATDDIWKSLDRIMDKKYGRFTKPEHIMELMPIIDLLLANNLIIYSKSKELGLWDSSYMKLSNPFKCAIFGEDTITFRGEKQHTNVLYVNMDVFRRIIEHRYIRVKFSNFIKSMTGILRISEFAIYNLKQIVGVSAYRNHVRTGIYRSVYDHMEILKKAVSSGKLVYRGDNLDNIILGASNQDPEDTTVSIFHDENTGDRGPVLAIAKVSDRDLSTAYEWETRWHSGKNRVIVFDIDQVTGLYNLMSKGISMQKYGLLLDTIHNFKKVNIG